MVWPDGDRVWLIVIQHENEEYWSACYAIIDPTNLRGDYVDPSCGDQIPGKWWGYDADGEEDFYIPATMDEVLKSAVHDKEFLQNNTVHIFHKDTGEPFPIPIEVLT